MVERLTITAMGKNPIRSMLEDTILSALENLCLNVNDETRAQYVASAILARGKFETFADHGEWNDERSHS